MSARHIPKETIVYGGAFYPPTRAHQQITEACARLAHARGGDVWLLPSASRDDKALPADRTHRLALCEALMADVQHENVQLCTAELDRAQPTRTYDTVQNLQAHHPDRTFRWVFGADSLATMQTWYMGAWLLQHTEMIIVERPRVVLPRLTHTMELLSVQTDDISSTMVRERMAACQPYEQLVGAAVHHILQQQK